MKNIIIIIAAAIFSLNVTAQEAAYYPSDKQVFFAGEGDERKKFAEREDIVSMIFRFEDKIIERRDETTGKSLITHIESVEQIRENIFEYRGIDEARNPTVIRTYSDELRNVIDIRVFFWNLYGPGEEDDVFICISHEIAK